MKCLTLFLCMSINLSLITLNCNGLHDSGKWLLLFCDILHLNANIITLQETYLMHDQLFTFSLGAPKYSWIFSNGTSNSAGVTIGLKKSVGIDIVSSECVSG